jgi:hypothetical protein
MISKIPDNSDALLSRAETAEALTEAGWRRVEPSRAREIHIDYANRVSWFARPRLLHSGRKEGAESPRVHGDGNWPPPTAGREGRGSCARAGCDD